MHNQCIDIPAPQRKSTRISSRRRTERVIVMPMILAFNDGGRRMCGNRAARSMHVLALLALVSVAAAAQGGAKADSSRRAAEDSARAQRLSDVKVSVTRTDATEQRAPWAVGV